MQRLPSPLVCKLHSERSSAQTTMCHVLFVIRNPFYQTAVFLFLRLIMAPRWATCHQNLQFLLLLLAAPPPPPNPPDSAALLIRASPPPDTRCPLTDTKLYWQLLSEQRGECLVRAVGLVLSLLSFRSELPSVKFKEIAGEVFGPQRPSDAKEMNAAFERESGSWRRAHSPPAPVDLFQVALWCRSSQNCRNPSPALRPPATDLSDDSLPCRSARRPTCRQRPNTRPLGSGSRCCVSSPSLCVCQRDTVWPGPRICWYPSALFYMYLV